MNAAPTVVAGGSDVTLHSGQALVSLDVGGEISICGPAHFTLLTSAGAVTLALDYGRVHPALWSAGEFTIYTPTIVATPIAVSGGSRDVTVGLDQNGEMCVLTARGAMRVLPQFSDQSLIVPQGGAVNLMGGQMESLRADAAACSCVYARSRVETPSSPSSPSRSSEISALSRPLPPAEKKPDTGAPATPVEEPVYTVLMPPLSFDANSPAPPPDPSPETILLVREVRVSPSVVFRGHVNPAPVQAASETPATAIPPETHGGATLGSPAWHL